MELKPDQINRFKELHKNIAGFDHFSDDQIVEITNGIANYYLALFKIYKRIKNEGKNLGAIPKDNELVI